MQHLNQHLTKYELKQVIGQGGMAKVYLAEHKTLSKKVAIKILNEDFVKNKNIRGRFLAEAKSMANMEHPNIVAVTDLITEGDVVAFVMEYIKGETLKNYLAKNGKLQDEQIKELCIQMLDALAYAHAQGFVHRDIKPSNFMILENYKIKLLDFGIAKNVEGNSEDYTQTGTSQQMGTLLYMSPEQLQGTKNVDAKSDIYSMGVVLWEMVMGRKPYDTSTLGYVDLLVQITKEKLLETGTKWDQVITKATEKKAEKRFRSAGEFRKGLEEVVKNEVGGATVIVNAPVQKPVSGEVTVVQGVKKEEGLEVLEKDMREAGKLLTIIIFTAIILIIIFAIAKNY